VHLVSFYHGRVYASAQSTPIKKAFRKFSLISMSLRRLGLIRTLTTRSPNGSKIAELNAEVQELNDELFGSDVVKSTSEILPEVAQATEQTAVGKYASLADELNAELGFEEGPPIQTQAKPKLQEMREQWKQRMQSGLSSAAPSHSKHLNRPLQFHDQNSRQMNDDEHDLGAIERDGLFSVDKYSDLADVMQDERGYPAPQASVDLGMLREGVTQAGHQHEPEEESTGSRQLTSLLLSGLSPTLSKVADLVASQDERIRREVSLREEAEREVERLQTINTELRQQHTTAAARE
jgi:hypothetical protein